MPGSAPQQTGPSIGQGVSNEAMGEIAQQMSAGAGQTSGVQTTQALQQMANQQQSQAVQPREVGTLGQELVKRPLADIAKGIKSIFSVDELLGVKKDKADPEKEVKKKQVHQRFNQLSQEEQAVARQRYQQEMERKQRMAEEEEMRRQQQAQQKSVEMPSSPQKGPAGPSGSKKQQAMQQLQDDRTKIGKVQSAN